MTDTTIEPRGVIAILTAPDGYVLAAEADFDLSTPGGTRPWTGQQYRAERAMRRTAIERCCAGAIAQAIDAYLQEQIVRNLCERGHRVTYRAIGWPDEDRREIERR